MAKSLQARIKAGDRKAIKQALSRPGTRRYVTDPKQLAGAGKLGQGIAKRRALTTRLAAPITQGSSVTERDLAHEAQSASSVQFGPKEAKLREDLGVAQTRAQDTGGFYDQYISQLAANRKAVADQGAATAAQLGQISSGITGLAGSEGAAMQQQANQRAGAQGVAQAGDLSQLASNAAATRQALLGSFQAQQAQQGAAANQYAGTLANVVGPGQKLAAQAQGQGQIAKARRDITDLAGQRGAWNQQYRTERRGEEAKNVLARGALGLKTATEAADQKTAALTRAETHRHNVAGESAADRRIQAAKDKSAADKAARGAVVNKYGITAERWSGMSEADRQQTIKDFGSGGRGKTGKSNLMPSGQAGPWYTQLGQLKGLAQKAKAGQPFVAGHKFPKPAPGDRASAGRRLLDQAGTDLKDPSLASAALDAAYLGFISANSVDRLQKAGLSAQRAAQTLGVPTWREYKKTSRTPKFDVRGQ